MTVKHNVRSPEAAKPAEPRLVIGTIKTVQNLISVAAVAFVLLGVEKLFPGVWAWVPQLWR